MKNKKLLALLTTPLGVAIVVGAIVLGTECLLMLLIGDFLEVQFRLTNTAWNFIDAITLTAIVSPALYFLMFRPLRKQQAELEDARKRIGQAFQEWIAALDVVNDPIFLHDQQLRILRCNKAYQQCAGLPFKQIIGQPYYEVFPKTHAPLSSCRRAMEKAKEEEEEEVVAGDAIYRSRAYSIHDEQGAYFYSIHTFEDITERKQAEDALKGSEEKNRLLFESSRDALMTLAPPSWKFTGANQATLKLFGASSVAEFTALGPWGVSPERQPDGRPSSEKAQEMIAIAMREGSHFFEWEYQRLGGQPFAADVLLTRMKVGADEFLQATVRDITERKLAENMLLESEERYRSLFENMPLGYAYCRMLFEHDMPLDYIYLSVNGAFVKITGLKNVAGKNVTNVIPGIRASNPELFEIYGRVALTGQPEKFETYVEALGIWFSVTAYSPRKEYFVAVFDDITGRKETDAKLQEMLNAANESRQVMLGIIEDQKRADMAVRQLNADLESKVAARTADLEQARLDAEQANRAKSEFLATMSHEIRTPMNGVIGMIDVLQQSSLKGYQVEMVNLIRESAFSLLDIIEDILDFSKVEAGKLEIETAHMSVVDVVEKACDLLDHLATRKGVEITLFTDPAIPEEALGDALRLRQVLVNLASNAIKFSSGQQRPGHVSVRALLAGHGTDQVTIEFQVADNGIGMNEETMAQLFTGFHQADISTTRRFGGTGLGLAISRHLVELMSGEIVVQSELGKGSTFTVRLPFVPLRAKSGADETESLVAGLPCLVVGGTDSLADDLAAYLTYGGALVEQAQDLAAARKLIGIHSPGLWLLIIDAGHDAPPVEELRTACRARPDLDPHFVVVEHGHHQPGIEPRFVVIRRGRRRHGRAQAVDIVTMDGDVMHRQVFLRAVAIAAGRAQEEEIPLPCSPAAAITKPSRENALRQGRLILVAEDNEINQKVILQQLALFGHTADIASTGREALERWQSGDYAILLADLHMPEMDGYELTTAIRAAETGKAHMPIIAFTANATKGEAERCLAVGMDDYLSKPVQLFNLKAMLGKWLPVAAEHMPAETVSIETVSPEAIDMVKDQNTVRAEPVEACPKPVEVAHSPFDKLRANGLQSSASVAVDVNVLKVLVGDDEATIHEFLHDFRISAAKIAVELRTACAAGQAAAAGAAAHKLKSSSRSVGALALGEICAEMEKSGKAGDSEALTALLPIFEQELANVESYLKEYLL